LGVSTQEANLPVFVRTSVGRVIAIAFRLDTGANISEVSADWARQSFIPFGGSRLTLTMTTGASTGSVTGWVGTVCVRLPMWGATEFQWPCFFREGRPPTLPRQLGMAGILNDLRFLLDGAPASGAPHGVLIVEERVAVGGGTP
jgi:hypothetical protein